MSNSRKNCLKIIPSHYCTEVLLSNVLDGESQAILLPFNLFQTLFFSSKYYIRDNFVTPNGYIANGISLCGTMVFILLYFYQITIAYIQMNITMRALKVFFYISNFYELIFYTFGFILNFASNVYYRNSNVAFILRLQEVHRTFQLDMIHHKRFIIWNWIHVIFELLLFTIQHVYMYILYGFFSVNRFLCTVALITFDLNIIYAYRMMRILQKNLYLWIKHMNQYSQLNLQTNIFNRDNDCKKFFDAYTAILEAYILYKNFLPGMICYYVLYIFGTGLFYVELMILLGKLDENASDIFYLHITGLGFGVFIWAIKLFILLISLSWECEKFYEGINDANVVCTQLILAGNKSEAEKRMLKNLHRVNRALFTKIQAFGLFTVDAALPLRLFRVLATYTIVLLQFAFN